MPISRIHFKETMEQKEKLQRLREYVARNNAVLDSELTIEIRFGLLENVKLYIDSMEPDDDLRLLLKLLGVLLAQELIRDLEADE